MSLLVVLLYIISHVSLPSFALNGTFPLCHNSLNLSMVDSPYTFDMRDATAVEHCLWNILIEPGRYASIRFAGFLGRNDKFSILHDAKETHYYSDPSGMVIDTVFWQPAGRSVLEFETSGEGSIQFTVTWKKISDVNATELVVPVEGPAALIDIETLKRTRYHITTNGNENTAALTVNAALSEPSSSYIDSLEGCFVLQGEGTTGQFMYTLRQAAEYPKVQGIVGGATILCVSNGNWTGQLLVQDSRYTSDLVEYSARLVSPDSVHSLDATRGKVGLTIINQQSTSTEVSSGVFKGDAVVAVTDSSPEKTPIGTFDWNQLPYFTKGLLVTYILESGTADLTIVASSAGNIGLMLSIIVLLILA